VAVFIVPLYAMMQAYSPRSHRARVVAANNILNAVFMVSSAIFSILILSVLKIDIKILFIITAVLSAIFSIGFCPTKTNACHSTSFFGGLIYAPLYWN
jgi:small neutral amino acid transporter SnatA (MarC family)